MLLGIFIGLFVGVLVGFIMVGLCKNAQIEDLMRYHDYTTKLYATGEIEQITENDLKRLKLFKLSKLQVI
jgi:hypothetical protein